MFLAQEHVHISEGWHRGKIICKVSASIVVILVLHWSGVALQDIPLTKHDSARAIDTTVTALPTQNSKNSSTTKPESLSAYSSLDENMKLTNNLSSDIVNKSVLLEDGLCTLTNVHRKSTVWPWAEVELNERKLTCSKVDEYNYHQIGKSVNRKNKVHIQQVQIIDSDPAVLFTTLDLICARFNCSKLTVFNVSGQDITDYAVLSSWIRSWPQLEVLDLSSTCIETIESILYPDSRPFKLILRNLTILNLDHNLITDLNFNFILEKMPNLKHLSLANNRIYDIICNESVHPRLKSQFGTINLSGNQINCDKSTLWLMKLILNPSTNIKFVDHDKINCSAPERLSEMTWSQRVSVLETRICEECECRSTKRTAIAVDCNNKNLTALPDILPLNTRILNLTSNKIDSLSLPQNSKNWENVTYVLLANNLITSFQPLEKNSKFMRNLAALDIRKNKFQEFPTHIFEQFTNLDQIHLSNNPWLCDCEPTFAFQEWLQRQFLKIGDKEDIMCGISGDDENGVRSHQLNQRLSSKIIYRLSKSELCPQETLEEPYDWLDVVNLTLGFMIILIFTKVTLDYIYQHRTKRLPQFFSLNLFR